jgi:hypothetical protein
VDALETGVERKPLVFGVLRWFESDLGVIDFGSINSDGLHLGEASIVNEIRVLSRPNAFGAKAVTTEHTADRVRHGFAVAHRVTGNLPKPAAVEVALGLSTDVRSSRKTTPSALRWKAQTSKTFAARCMVLC